MGACSLWPVDPDCCDLPDGTEIDPTWQQVASDILWAAGGRRHGVCEITVRPCVRRCGGGSGASFVPYKDADGAWRNFNSCGCRDDCSCTALSEVILQGPVASVVEVTIDGTALDPAAYRLDKVGTGWRLLRVDGGSWPDCQDMTADCTESGSFCVTYEQGIPLDALAIAAVSQAACELTKACIVGCKTCKLPANVVSVVRRGVAINLEQVRSAVLVLPLVAAWLQAVNPNGLTSGSSVWSPDIARVRTTPIEVS